MGIKQKKMIFGAEYIKKFDGRLFFKAHGNFYELLDAEFIGNGGANGIGGVKRTGKPVLVVVREINRHHVTTLSFYYEGTEAVKVDVTAFNRAIMSERFNAPQEVIEDLLEGVTWVINPDKYFKEKEGIIGVAKKMYFYKKVEGGYNWAYAELPKSFWAEFDRSWNWGSFRNEEGFIYKLSQMRLSANIQINPIS